MTVLLRLYEHYQRLLADPDSDIAAAGYSREFIHFAIELAADGKPVGKPLDLRSPDGKKWRPRHMLVPRAVKRSSNVAANFLWDKSDYLLGLKPALDKKDPPLLCPDQLEAFRNYLFQARELAETDEGFAAVLRFYSEFWRPEAWAELDWPSELLGANLVFCFYQDEGLAVHERPAVREYWRKCSDAEPESPGPSGTCLITGRFGPVQLTHASIKGVRGAQSSGASLVSFNSDAFLSYNKKQSSNAPVSPEAEFGYTTALNYLINQKDRRIPLGESQTIVFWSDGATAAESLLQEVIGDPYARAEDEQSTRILGEFLTRFVSWKDGGNEPEYAALEGKSYFILGLSPNAARLALSFWHESTLAELAEHLNQHFVDLEIVDQEGAYPGWAKLLLSLTPSRKFEDLSTTLISESFRALFTGRAYPFQLLRAAIDRVARDQGRVTWARAALIKAYLNRHYRECNRNHINHENSDQKETYKEVKVSLDIERKEPGYRLGRLFAWLERAQYFANQKPNDKKGDDEGAKQGHKLNSTIRDKFFATAVFAPGTVFPRLLTLAQAHIDKAGKQKWRINFDRAIQEILDGIHHFPKQLNNEQQGEFLLGYYHQSRDFFVKNEIPESTDEIESTEGGNHD